MTWYRNAASGLSYIAERFSVDAVWTILSKVVDAAAYPTVADRLAVVTNVARTLTSQAVPVTSSRGPDAPCATSASRNGT